MICPDVWQLNPPDTFIQCKQLAKLTSEAELEIKKKISAHYFNQLISIVLPETTEIPIRIEQTVADSDHYIVKDIRLVEFIDRQFIEGFIKRGTLYGLSVDTRIDVDDCAAITPCGTLLLTLNKEIYQSLGLEGSLSFFSRKSRDRYTIKINLKNPELTTATKLFERVKTALAHKLLNTFTFRFSWTPPNDTICTSSLAKYFSESRQLSVELVPTKIKCHKEYSLRMPLIGRDEELQENIIPEFHCSPHELVEYVGMLSLACNFKADDYLNSYVCRGKTKAIESAQIWQWQGLFADSMVSDIFDGLKEFIKERPELPWVSLYCQGFPHSPVSYALKEHNFGTNGDNSYIIFLTPNEEYLIYQILGSNKMTK